MNNMGRVLQIVALGEFLLALLCTAAAAVFSIPALFIPAAALVLVAASLLILSRYVKASAKATHDLLTNGTPATATIKSMRQTSTYVNGQPRVIFELMVTVPGHPAYPVTIKGFVPIIYSGRLTSERPLAVRVDPLNAQRVVIDWAH